MQTYDRNPMQRPPQGASIKDVLVRGEMGLPQSCQWGHGEFKVNEDIQKHKTSFIKTYFVSHPHPIYFKNVESEEVITMRSRV